MMGRKHAHISGHFIAFAQIAGRAGRHDIFPGCCAAFRTWNDMIESEFFARAAILARESITQEDIEAGKCRLP